MRERGGVDTSVFLFGRSVYPVVDTGFGEVEAVMHGLVDNARVPFVDFWGDLRLGACT